MNVILKQRIKFFIILVLAFFLHNTYSMDNHHSGSNSPSPIKHVIFSRSDSPSTNTRTQSLSPTRKKSPKNSIFRRTDINDTGEHITKPRSKTDPEIHPYVLKPTISPSLLSSNIYLEDRSARSKDRKKISHKLIPSPTKQDFSEFGIARSKLDPCNDWYYFLKDHDKNPNIQDIKTRQTIFHCVVLSKNEMLLDHFLQHPGLNSLITNNDGIMAYQYITGADIIKYPSLYEKLQLRATLDQLVYALLVTNETFFQKNPFRNLEEEVSSLLLRISRKIIPSYSTTDFIKKMVQFCLEHNAKELEATQQEYKRNLNYQDSCGNTFLHLVVILRNEKVIEKLIEDPTITCLKKNKENKLPQSLLSSIESNIGEIRSLLFMRDSIERWTLEAIEGELISNPVIDPFTLTKENGFIKNVISLVKQKSITISQTQRTEDDNNQDRALPDQACEIPSYATDDFFLTLIQHQLIERKSIH